MFKLLTKKKMEAIEKKIEECAKLSADNRVLTTRMLVIKIERDALIKAFEKDSGCKYCGLENGTIWYSHTKARTNVTDINARRKKVRFTGVL